MALSVSASELCASVKISDVCIWLGIGPVKRGRIIACWRGGKNHNVAQDDSRNRWRDYVAGESGGVLDLIIRVRGGDRKSALQWLADAAGVSLQGWSRERRREYAQLFPLAQRLGQDVADYRNGALEVLNERMEDLKALAMFALENEAESLYEALDKLADPIRKAIAKIETASPADLTESYLNGLRSNRARADGLRRVGFRTRKSDQKLTWQIVEILAKAENPA